LPEAVAPLLDVRDLHVSFRSEDGLVRAVDGISFTVGTREIVGIVGESGSGKSMTAMAIMRLIRDPNAVIAGQVLYRGTDLFGLSRGDMRDVRGAEIAMVFQDPMTSLTPVYRVGWQIAEQIRAHERVSRPAAMRRAVDLLGAVGIPHPKLRVDDYPHQFSGGMRQRAMIAMALSCNPELLIADEPTTALDVTVQAQILDLMADLQQEFGSAVIIITHDMGVIADVADRVLVVYAGRIVEDGPKLEVFDNAQHPYTWGLLGSIPRLDRPKATRLHSIEGMPPSLISPPQGCKFRPRCPHAFEKCMEEPDLVSRVDKRDHLDRCWLEPSTKRAIRYQTIEGGQAA
jgi:peptide/nickel transport system ATP-binding protein